MNTLPTIDLKIFRFDHAVFYCINQSSERLPVSVVSDVILLPDKRLNFHCLIFPLKTSGTYLQNFIFIKRRFFNMNIHGTARFKNDYDLSVQFKVLYVESAGM